ncbi:TIGR03086 family protein [Nocardioides seonyuensis]|uniref:TIGR03086 family protein n=1 Tax=Nocardioides seonyuensis TaxID=2518371 RepID=A0A4V1BM07_9ACTN|nr:TIGR03086 family metal-binding protein [Nocardioides seonyuensis]QBX54712.1 TIGR03086 family protein [Nocardioides seonyuensis]
MAPSDPAERHRLVASGFASVVAGVTDWSAPAPVAGWTARDVVDHLVDWFPSFLSAGGVELAPGPRSDEDPVGAWEHQSSEVQALLEQRGEEDFTHPRAGSHRLSDAVDLFYTADVFMHTWDLARASGQDVDLDPDYAARLLTGMQGIEEMLRDSGQYGPAVPVPADAPVVDRLMGFIGRDPAWTAQGSPTASA